MQGARREQGGENEPTRTKPLPLRYVDPRPVDPLGPASPSMAAEPMAIKDANAVFKQWIAAYQARDAEKIMAVFDKTLIYSTQGEADQNYAELKKGYQEFFATKSSAIEMESDPEGSPCAGRDGGGRFHLGATPERQLRQG